MNSQTDTVLRVLSDSKVSKSIAVSAGVRAALKWTTPESFYNANIYNDVYTTLGLIFRIYMHVPTIPNNLKPNGRSASRSFFEEMDLLADRAMPVTLVLRIPLSCPADSPNITVLERVLSYSGSPLTEYEVGSSFEISRVLRIFPFASMSAQSRLSLEDVRFSCYLEKLKPNLQFQQDCTDAREHDSVRRDWTEARRTLEEPWKNLKKVEATSIFGQAFSLRKEEEGVSSLEFQLADETMAAAAGARAAVDADVAGGQRHRDGCTGWSDEDPHFGKRSLPIENASTTIDFRLRIHMAALCVDLFMKNQNARVLEKRMK
ncbi:hypothetical protein WN51_11256 [Melipona quadrifasciata]|uniref:Uncharacterized protein n=1 Tax=Melipona quadrifasciata TaxID=166423 RepID=A0A0N0BHV1_9HYME|nr:hypothetical protein WN51_11256 [Melipona quadrifasciata]